VQLRNSGFLTAASHNGFSTNMLLLHKKTDIIRKIKKIIRFFVTVILYHKSVVKEDIFLTFCWVIETSFCDAAVAKSTVLLQHPRDLPLYTFVQCTGRAAWTNICIGFYKYILVHTGNMMENFLVQKNKYWLFLPTIWPIYFFPGYIYIVPCSKLYISLL